MLMAQALFGLHGSQHLLPRQPTLSRILTPHF